MPRRALVLTEKQVRALCVPGLHAVGVAVPGLALQITQTPGNPPARSWVLRPSKAAAAAWDWDPYPAVTLAEARKRAEDFWRAIREWRDPLRERRDERARQTTASAPPTAFEQAASQYIKERRASRRNLKHSGQWEATLRTYAYPVIGTAPVADVDRAIVLKVVKPIWNEKTETAKRVQDRIKLVPSWAKAHDLREGENPAEWRGNLEHTLAAPEKVARTRHQPALPVNAIGDFVRRLRSEQTDLAARALEFLILKAARDGEVRGATWDEIDLDAAVWTIPAERMKAGEQHRVPPSAAALAILKGVPRIAGTNLVFAGQSSGGRLSENTFNQVIKRLHARQPVPSDAKGRPAVVRGMRGTFRNWGREVTSFRPELLELALAHTVGNAAERAYARGNALDLRRVVMDAWAAFVLQSGMTVRNVTR